MTEGIMAEMVADFYRLLVLMVWVALVLVRVWSKVEAGDDDDDDDVQYGGSLHI